MARRDFSGVTSEQVLSALRAGPFFGEGYAWFYQVSNGTGWHGRKRFADALVLSCWPSRGINLSGIEVKVSRSDWRRELDIPEKAEAIAKWCVALDTRVLTLDLRWVRAGDLKDGDRLIGFDEAKDDGPSRLARKWRPSTVTGLRVQRAPVFRIEMESGASLRCTGDHMWLASTGGRGHGSRVDWRSTENIAKLLRRRNCSVFLPRYMTPWERLETHDAGYLAAALDGEGCLPTPRHRKTGRAGRGWSLFFAQKRNSMLEKVKRILVEHGFNAGEYIPADRSVIVLKPSRNLHDVVRFLGQMRPVRLLDNWERQFCEFPCGMRTYIHDRIVAVVPDGSAEVAVMTTSTRTFIAEGYASHNCDYWWIAAPTGVVQLAELPKKWGLYEVDGKKLTVVKAAPKLKRKPFDLPFIASLLRNGASQIDAARQAGHAAGYEAAERANNADAVSELQQKLYEAERAKTDAVRDAGWAQRDLAQLKANVAAFEKSAGLPEGTCSRSQYLGSSPVGEYFKLAELLSQRPIEPLIETLGNAVRTLTDLQRRTKGAAA